MLNRKKDNTDGQHQHVAEKNQKMEPKIDP